MCALCSVPLLLPLRVGVRFTCTQMENVSNFLKACRSVGVAEHSLFETVDLYEAKDLGLVVRCLVRLVVGQTG